MIQLAPSTFYKDEVRLIDAGPGAILHLSPEEEAELIRTGSATPIEAADEKKEN